MKLVIAEKPSVAMALASVLGARTRKDGYVEGNGYIVSWCVGHLVGLCDASEYDEKYKKWRYEDLPIVPECWKHKILEGTKKQFGILKKLMRDSKVDEVICATDAGREGELIFRLVYEQAGCKKPMKRLWISSMEEQAIKDGFASLKDGSCYDSLYQSALCRAKADWLVGINASRLFSVLYNQNLKVGRVQTPTLAMIVDRNQKIKEFTKEKYYMAHIKFDDMDAVTEHFQKKEDADKVAAECQERMCEVEKDDVKEKTVRPPKLYDLTTLQREANRMFGYTAQQTLDAVQEMYEQKLVTYPRTDSQYLTDEMGESTETLIQMLFGKMPYAEGLEYQPDVSKALILRHFSLSDNHDNQYYKEKGNSKKIVSPDKEKRFSDVRCRNFVVRPFLVGLFSFKEEYRMTNIVNSTLPTPNNHSEKNKPDGVFVIKQGKTNYKVKVFFDHSSGLTAEDRLKRIIQAEAERESA